MSLIPLAFAQTQVDATKFGNVINPIVNNIVKPALLLVFALALLVFAWGIVKMIIYADDAEARTNGRWSMLWGAVGMFIMISAWGIIYLISNTIKGI